MLDPVIPNILPQYADFPGVSAQTRMTWQSIQAERANLCNYYDGKVFLKKVEEETGDDSPEMYPVGVNLVKMLVLAMTDATFGEWEDDIVLFEGEKNTPMTDAIKKTAGFLKSISSRSNLQSILWEQEFDRNLMGAAVMRVNVGFAELPYIRWSKVPLDGFYPVFDPENPDKLLECYYVNFLTTEQVRQKYKIDVSALGGVSPFFASLPNTGDYVVRVEHWTLTKYEVSLNGRQISEFSGVNPWGLIPFVYIPRIRTTDIWGESLAQDLIRPQDELNMRLADIGDALNYNSHPVRYGINMPKKFDAKNFPLGANSFWDLGRSFDEKSRPEVGTSEIKNPVPEAAFNYIKFIYDWSRTASSTPPIAFGEDNGGGQRSGVTLEIRLWPLLKAVRRSRSYLTAGIKQMIKITAVMLRQKGFVDVESEIIDCLDKDELEPKYSLILPRDQSAVVDQVVKLLSTEPPSISLETAMSMLGFGVGELDRIEETLAMIQEIAEKKNEMEIEKAKATKPEDKPEEVSNMGNKEIE